MIKSITIINNFGDKKEIELGAPEISGLWVKDIKGIGPGKANINVTELATNDGGIYNSARSEVRNITLTLGFIPYTIGEGTSMKSYSVEDVRRDLYKWFAKKRQITFIVNLEQVIDQYDTRRINLGCSGYIESNEPNIFNKQETTSISIICPDPNMYLYDNKGRIISEEINFSATNDSFDFPMVFVRTHDHEFLPDKVYYEKKSNDTYEITADEFMKPLKAYYEEISILELSEYIDHWKLNESTGQYEQVIVYDEHGQIVRDPYIIKQCEEGYENPITIEYFETQDETMQSGKEYFEEMNGEIVPTEDIGSFDPSKTYYEYESVTELATLTTIANESKNYDGEIEIGLSFRIYISGEVTGLSLYKIYDAYNYDVINIDDAAIALIPGLSGGGLSSGDEIRICTISGKKSAILIREAREYNMMNALGKNPDWIKLDQGSNTFSYGAQTGSENVSVNIEFSKAYEGV